jgi:hypothetical protein
MPIGNKIVVVFVSFVVKMYHREKMPSKTDGGDVPVFKHD